MIAVAYARYSSDNQRAESITAQLRAIRDYATKNNIEIVKEYIDEAETGTSSDNREAFLRMVDDVQRGSIKPNVCLIHKIDRFARDDYDHVVNERKLNQNKVRLIAVDQPLDDTPEGDLTKTLLIGLAKYYSKNLARETKKGLKENALKALHCGGIPPLGYDIVDLKYTINTTEAAAVKLMFEMKANGFGYTKIIDALNKKGYKTKRGGIFGKNSIHDILVNEKYIGTFTFNKGFEDNHRQQNDNIIRLPEAIPAIVDTDTWNKVQNIMNGNRLAIPRQKSEVNYILTGKLQCGVCGSAYVGCSRTGGEYKHKYHMYICNNRKNKGECNNKDIRKEPLEDAILKYLQQVFYSESVEYWIDKLEESYREESEVACTKEQDFKKDMEQISRAISNLYGVIEKGLDDDETLERIQLLKAKKKRIEYELNYIDVKKTTRFSREEIKVYLEECRKILFDKNNPLDQKEVIDQFIERVVIGFDDIKIDFKLSKDADNLVVLTRTMLISASFKRKELHRKHVSEVVSMK